MSNLRKQLIQVATEAGDLEYAAWVASKVCMFRTDILARLRHYGV